MKGTKEELVKAWFRKAENDLISAEKLSREPNITLDTSVYHCQQCAEKAIKGYLVYLDMEIPKTHDLRVLINIASEEDNTILVLQEAADFLTPLSVEFRYPDDDFEPTTEEFNEAFKYAQLFYNYLISKIF
jgi:HEPN domain-containing protein